MRRPHCPLGTSHSRKGPASLPLNRLRLSGVKARLYTSAVCPCSAAQALACATSHSQIVWSRLPLAKMRPSGLQATQSTRSVCPTSVWRPRPLTTSQSLIVPSWLPLARVLPSGAKASPITQLLCPTNVCMQVRSEEHTSELQSPDHLVCRLLLEKKKKRKDSEHDRPQREQSSLVTS